jgi:hypothetical protein
MDSTKKLSTDFLTDLERVNVEAAVENSVLMDALKKVLMYGVLVQGVPAQEGGCDLNRNWVFGILGDSSLSSEDKLIKMNAYSVAMGEINRAFEDMLKLRKPEEKQPKENMAR